MRRMRILRPCVEIDCEDKKCGDCHFSFGDHYKYCLLFSEKIRDGYNDDATRCRSCLRSEIKTGGGDGMSHTPGPWKFEVVEDTGRFMGCKRLDGEGESTVIDLSNEWTGYPECGQDLQMTISKEDAALIESAPEMLEKIKRLEAEKAEMLRALEAVTGDSEESDYMTQAQIQGLCRAAIRKARGGE